MSERERIDRALVYAFRYGQIDGAHHRVWVIDQMVRALLGCPIVEEHAVDANGNPYTYKRQGESEEYTAWVANHENGGEYEWDRGIVP